MDPSVNTDIYAYENYRRFLGDYYAQEKAKRPQVMSYRYLSRQAGFASANAIHLVIRNQRNLSLASARRVAKALKLKSRETKFFEHLVQFNQSRCPQEKQDAYRAMRNFREYREANTLSEDQYELFSSWYIPVIREMVNLEQFQECPQWIAKHIYPRISVEEATQALERLIALGLLVHDDNGKLVQADAHIASSPEILNSALLNFHSQMIPHGAKALQYPSKVRNVSSLTVSLPKTQYKALAQMVADFQQQVQSFVAEHNNEKSDQIYQMNIQVFPFVTVDPANTKDTESSS